MSLDLANEIAGAMANEYYKELLSAIAACIEKTIVGKPKP